MFYLIANCDDELFLSLYKILHETWDHSTKPIFQFTCKDIWTNILRPLFIIINIYRCMNLPALNEYYWGYMTWQENCSFSTSFWMQSRSLNYLCNIISLKWTNFFQNIGLPHPCGYLDTDTYKEWWVLHLYYWHPISKSYPLDAWNPSSH